MAKRRKFLAGLGALASGSAAAVGTGAFTSASTGDRTVNVNTAADSGSFLTIEPSGGSNGDYAEESDGTLQLNFNENNDTGSGTLFKGEGVNEGSEYTFDNVFVINNQGNTEVDTWVTTSGLSGVQFYQDGNPDDRLEEELWSTGGTKSNLNISQQGVKVGVKIIEEDLDSDSVSGSVTIHAEDSPASIRD
ncbi:MULTISPECIES: DUF1102 domain-containing protein [Halorubrum]|uniref:DUF1102 domain-containing protein n=1 Tax=Halorubrum TaxID=56688 RepID=UPI0009B5D243|nr:MULTISPECIES: DUF1102 domain-containing protein [Halorubrum]